MAGFLSAGAAGATACLERLPEEEEGEWREWADVFDRRLRLARAAVVFSRAIAARESRLCLGAEL